jgi:hypothetical protein
MTRAALSLLILGLAGCGADTVNYPSLARRPAERAAAPAPAPTAPAPASPDAQALARFAELEGQARAAHARFLAARETAERRIEAAAAAAPGSETWAVASVALAGLEAARSEAMVALAELDQTYAQTRIEGGDGTAVAAARDRVIALIAEEDRVLAGLRGRLGD